MAFELRDNSGSLWVNDRKSEDRHPDRTGSAKIDGVEYYVHGSGCNEMANARKIPQKLPKPALDCGRVQRAARRVFIAAGGLVSTSEVVQAAYCRKVRQELESSDYRQARRALARIAVRVRRSPAGSGRAWLWRSRNGGENDDTDTV
jgi:hypothetical protein